MPPPAGGVQMAFITIARYKWMTWVELKDYYNVDEETADRIAESAPRKRRRVFVEGDTVEGVDSYWYYEDVYKINVSVGPGDWRADLGPGDWRAEEIAEVPPVFRPR